MFHGTSHKTNMVWPINRRSFEINVTNRCNLACPNCQACAPTAPDPADLDPKHVARLVDFSVEHAVVWRKLKLTGGEALLHPRLDEIVEHLDRYRRFISQRIRKSRLDLEPPTFRILTNGSLQKNLPPWLKPQNQDTQSSRAWTRFEPFNVAPADLPEYQSLPDEVYRQACLRVTKCGGGALGTDGLYYPCAVAYHVARVFQIDCGLPGPNAFLKAPDHKLRDALQQTCKYCGYFTYPRSTVQRQTTSPSWEHALKSYRSRNTSGRPG